MAEGLLQLRDVTKSYGARDSQARLTVLSGINLSLQRGESLAVVGPSGSGKSTLLNIIGTLDEPTSGEVELDQQVVSQLDQKQLAEIRSRKIGFIFQGHHLLPQCSVLENVLVPTLAVPRPQREGSGARALALLEKVGLRERLHHRPGELSGGECQRVAVVRALINNPILLLADEPTGALDRNSAAGLGELLLQLNREHQVSLIVVTHARELAAQMGRLAELRNGQLVNS